MVESDNRLEAEKSVAALAHAVLTVLTHQGLPLA
jgi:hypothetical protein